MLNAEVILVSASLDVLHARAEAERPPEWHGYVDLWHQRFTPCGIDAIVRTD